MPEESGIRFFDRKDLCLRIALQQLPIVDLPKGLISDPVGKAIRDMSGEADIIERHIRMDRENVGSWALRWFYAVAEHKTLVFRVLQKLPADFRGCEIDKDFSLISGQQGANI